MTASSGRRSIDGGAPRHENPIPNASRIGRLVMSSVIVGYDPGTRTLPPTIDDQLRNIFAYARHDLEAAGGSLDDIIKMTFWVGDPASQRGALNAQWQAAFPDPLSRPARHTLALAPGIKALVQADFTAVLSA